MNRQQLRDEILNDPVSIGYAPHVASGADSLIAELLNAKSRSLLRPIPIFEFAMWCSISGVRAKLKAGTASENAAIAAICDTALSVQSNPHATYLDLTDAGSMELLTALAQAGVVTQAESQALVAFCTRPTSRAEELFGFDSYIGDPDVAKALRG